MAAACTLTISQGHLGYLISLVRQDIRKHQPGIDRFQPRPGQDQAEASQVLAHFEEKQRFRHCLYEDLRRAWRGIT